MRPVLACVLGAAAIAFVPGIPARAGDTATELAAPPSPADVARSLGGAGAAGSGEARSTPAVGATPLSPTTVPFIFEGGHIIVEAAIDGQPAKPFIFDTGALTMLTRQAAKELHIKLDGTDSITGGIGSNLVRTDGATVDRIAIGAAVLEHQKIDVAELRNALVDRGARPAAAGLLGSELLRVYVIRIDYANRQLTLIPAGAFRPPSDGFVLPLSVSVTRRGKADALLSAEIDHVPARLIVDTGAGGQVHIAAHFEGEHQLFAHYPKTLRALTAGGVGGHAPMRFGLGQSFMLGPVSFSTPFVTTPDDDGVPIVTKDTSAPRGFARRYESKQSEFGPIFFSDGLIGNGVLAHFIVTLDYKNGRIYFEAPRDMVLMKTWQNTGLFVDKPDHDGFEIIDVLPGTPGERAGLHRGDRIIVVNDHPARELGMADFGPRSEGGAPAILKLETADGRRVELALAQLLP